MMRGPITFTRVRAAGLVLALFALTFKAVLPPGFMLEAEGARIVVALCGGGQAMLDLDGDGDGAPDGAEAAPHCPFAPAGAPVLSAPVFMAPPPRAGFADFAAPIRATPAIPTVAGPPLPARGPPHTA